MVARAALLAANLSEASFALSSSLIFMEVVSIFMRSPNGGVSDEGVADFL